MPLGRNNAEGRSRTCIGVEARRLQRRGPTDAQPPQMVRAAGIEPAIFHLSGGCSATEPGTEMLNDRYRVVKEREESPETKAASGDFPGGRCEGRVGVRSIRLPLPSRLSQWPPLHLEIPGYSVDKAAE